MIDSRYEATKHYISSRWPLTRNITLFFLIPLLAWLVAYMSKDIISSSASVNALFLLLVAAGWWITEAMPPFAVSLFIIGFAIYFLDNLSFTVLSEDWEKYTNTWSNPIIWILLGGFFLAIGAQLTQLDQTFSQNVLQRFSSKPHIQLLVIMILACVFSMFISNTSTTAMMVIIVAPILRTMKKDEPMIKAFVLGIPAAATVGGMGTIIGSAPNAIAVGTMQVAGIDFGFAQWMAIGVPLAFGFTFLLWWLLIRRFPTTLEAISFGSVDVDNAAQVVDEKDRIIVMATFAVTILLWVTQPLHGISIAATSFVPIVTFSVTGIIKSSDIRLIPWDILILVAGGLTLGVVIHDSGLAYNISNWIPDIGIVFPILLLFGYLSSILSNIMSNTAASSVLIPIGITILPDDMMLMSLSIGLCASTALLFPISTPPNAIAYATGYLMQRDFRYTGIIMAILGPVLIVSLLYLFF
ncbi:MAG: DASS family sodium-coupled anion symporter [Cyclobacteriaceae bacterium]